MPENRDQLEANDALLEIALQLGQTLELDRLIPVVLKQFAAMTMTERALFVTFRADGEVERVIPFGMTLPDDGSALPISSTVLRQVRESKKPVVVPDTSSNVDFKKQASVRMLELRMLIGVPVLVEDQVAAVLYADSHATAGKQWKPRLDLLSALSRIVSTAVINMRLYEEQRYQTRVLAEMAHALRSPLNVVLISAELLQSSPDKAPVAEVASDILAMAARMQNAVSQTLDLCAVNTARALPKSESIFLQELLPPHIDLFRSWNERSDVDVQIDIPSDLPAIQSVPNQLLLVIDNLYSNALKRALTGSTIDISVRLCDAQGPDHAPMLGPNEASLFRGVRPLSATPKSPFVEISVSNQGPSVSPELRSRIFAAFARHDDEGNSSGLGLSIVAHCVHHLGGAVRCLPQGDRTCFSFSLPVEIEL